MKITRYNLKLKQVFVTLVILVLLKQTTWLYFLKRDIEIIAKNKPHEEILWQPRVFARPNENVEIVAKNIADEEILRQPRVFTIPDDAEHRVKGIFMEDTSTERPLFAFLRRPWKVETTIANKTTCDNKLSTETRWSMVFVIKSAITNYDRRNAIRKIWGGVKVFNDARFEVVFVIGTSTKEGSYQNILKENKEFGDILQFNVEDTDRSVPDKVIAGMQWASTLPSYWLYSSIDDDIVVNYARLHAYFTHLLHGFTLSSSNTIQFEDIPVVCVYSYQDQDPPARDPKSKWYMAEKDFPGKYWPAYCRGGMYSTSSDMVKKLFKVSRRTRKLYLDDVWITGFMRLKVEHTDNNVVPAIGSMLSDYQLRNTTWQEDAIVYHLWGNTAEKEVDVASELMKIWKDIVISFADQIKCKDNVGPANRE